MTQVLVESITTLRQGIDKLEKQIGRSPGHPRLSYLRFVPGCWSGLGAASVGRFRPLAPRCYAAASDVQKFSGIAPVMERSGKSEWVHFRRACPNFLRQTFHEWVGHSIGFCEWARVYYGQQKRGGKDHHAAVRSLAFKWIRIAFRCWQDRIPYDDAR